MVYVMKKELINFILQNIFYLLSTCFFVFLIILIIKKNKSKIDIIYFKRNMSNILSIYIWIYSKSF